MATLIIGYLRSECKECFYSGKHSGASLTESGHYTVIGYGFDQNVGGCQQKWDKAVLSYAVDAPADEVVDSLKKRWPKLAGIDDWSVISTWQPS